MDDEDFFEFRKRPRRLPALRALALAAAVGHASAGAALAYFAARARWVAPLCASRVACDPLFAPACVPALLRARAGDFEPLPLLAVAALVGAALTGAPALSDRLWAANATSVERGVAPLRWLDWALSAPAAVAALTVLCGESDAWAVTRAAALAWCAVALAALHELGLNTQLALSTLVTCVPGAPPPTWRPLERTRVLAVGLVPFLASWGALLDGVSRSRALLPGWLTAVVAALCALCCAAATNALAATVARLRAPATNAAAHETVALLIDVAARATLAVAVGVGFEGGAPTFVPRAPC